MQSLNQLLDSGSPMSKIQIIVRNLEISQSKYDFISQNINFIRR